MSEEMKFPDTLDEFIKQYSFIDEEQIYTNGSELIHTFRVKQWEEHKKQENQELKKQLDCALEILSEVYPPCDIDNFMDKHSDYCQLNCSVDIDIFKKCWLMYIEEKLKEVE